MSVYNVICLTITWINRHSTVLNALILTNSVSNARVKINVKNAYHRLIISTKTGTVTRVREFFLVVTRAIPHRYVIIASMGSTTYRTENATDVLFYKTACTAQQKISASSAFKIITLIMENVTCVPTSFQNVNNAIARPSADSAKKGILSILTMAVQPAPSYPTVVNVYQQINAPYVMKEVELTNMDIAHCAHRC